MIYNFVSTRYHHFQVSIHKTLKHCDKEMTPNDQTNGGRKIVDICDLVLDYVTQFPFAKDVKSRINLDDIHSSDIDFTRLFVTHKKTEYLLPNIVNGDTKQSIAVPPKTLPPTLKRDLKSHVLFSSIFTNKTSETQTNHLRTERRTSSSCRLSLQKVVTKGGSINLQIGPPSMSVQANGGFRREITMSKDIEEVFEEELTWTLDTEIVVPPGYKTRAELIITEDEYYGKFQVETIFEGSISVKLRDKKDGSVVSVVVINDLSKFLTAKNGFHPIPNSTSAVCFVNEGFCHCHYGIGQRVELQEEKI
ncbi:unnamed protein product [Schistosoma bovis]|uniref:Uncharacterized protein n=1 Tax=Schistosoma bovis TaxID=6184 RepID=A0A430QL41_SCHBO|nr:uncharacterized protein DC041_0012991 [Schistosoma bovis]CAH8603973.1 unnamed protein product [Schistosoma bovis]CAH8609541.1 unnamed protein product [Schistosoma bovis]